MDIADPNFLVKKAPKPRTPAQIAATEKGLAALKAKRNALANTVSTLKEKGPAPILKTPKMTAPQPVAEDSESEDSEPLVVPVKKAKAAPVAPAAPALDAEGFISAIASRVSESLGAKKKKTKRVVYEEESSSSEEEVIIRRRAPSAPIPAPRAVPLHISRSAVLSRLFDKQGTQ